MFYIIYKTTNTINGKFYIGKHKTKCLDDGYMGSGKILKHAISKYGVENFHREILYSCKTEREMNLFEKILVVPDPEINYNLCPGGHGGFGYINTNASWNTEKHRAAAIRSCAIRSEKFQDLVKDPKWKKDWIEKTKTAQLLRTNHKDYVHPWQGRKHTEQTKKKMSKIKNIGQTNSQFGTMWITNGTENKKIKKEVDIIPDGWYKGRNMRP